MIRNFGWIEAILLGLFLIAYGIYLWRIIRISRALHSPAYTIIFKLVLRSVAVGLIIVSILGPSYGDSKKEIKSVGKDIMLCVDLSKSMDAFDIQPTRLEKIKFELKKIVAAFNSDRLGLVIFSSEAFMQCPLTYDQNALNLFIETMNTNLVPASGTDFGPPLKMALSKMKDDKSADGSQKSKVIVLISDGEDFGEETNDIARQVEDDGIRLFTLGVGTEQGSQIAASRGFKTDQKGNVVVSKLNPASLKTLASKTDGQYFEINNTRNDVNRLINAINKIEGQMRDSRMVDVSANRYFYFLLGALLLLVVDVLISVRTIRI
ncbi:MAG TPA: VWA domain-containing protein [Cyclobacteriaceae bacterium]|nr:VWA domain-containing protein [Cytophagales bacterium]HRE68628.1 VWA domain-containing protein [Cyclobacteriaceae bacterium]HRF34957.1 VWA domain-containing protein [Cyclobacteriaceae bacterium]